MNMVKYENVRRYVIYESNVPRLCLYHLSLVTKRLGPDQTQIHHNSNVPACGIVSFYDWDSELSNWSSTIYISHISHIFTYHHFISPPPNKIQPSPSVTKSEYFMTSSCSGLLPCHPMSVKEPVHHGGVFFDLFLRNHDAQWAFFHDRLMIILLVELWSLLSLGSYNVIKSCHSSIIAVSSMCSPMSSNWDKACLSRAPGSKP